jgi:hypothetical protein
MKSNYLALNLIILVFIITYPCIANSQHVKTITDRAVPIGNNADKLFGKKQFDQPLDPVIIAMVEEVSSDTLHKNMLELQNWGSRFMLKDNHKDLATWFEGNLQQGPQGFSYQINQYPSGLYQVVLLTDEGIISRKIVKL